MFTHSGKDKLNELLAIVDLVDKSSRTIRSDSSRQFGAFNLKFFRAETYSFPMFSKTKLPLKIKLWWKNSLFGNEFALTVENSMRAIDSTSIISN